MITANNKKGFPDGSLAKIPPANAENAGSITGAKTSWRTSKQHPPSKLLAWKFPRTEEPGGNSSTWGLKASGTIEKLKINKEPLLTGANVFEIPLPKSLEKSEKTAACRVKRQPGSPQTTSNPTT